MANTPSSEAVLTTTRCRNRRTAEWGVMVLRFRNKRKPLLSHHKKLCDECITEMKGNEWNPFLCILHPHVFWTPVAVGTKQTPSPVRENQHLFLRHIHLTPSCLSPAALLLWSSFLGGTLSTATAAAGSLLVPERALCIFAFAKLEVVAHAVLASLGLICGRHL